MTLPEVNPIRTCCMRQHTKYGSVMCDDGQVRCCICFGMFRKDDLHVEDGVVTDMCEECGNTNA